MKDHINTLGILFVVYNGLGVLAAVICYVVIAGIGMLTGDTDAMVVTTTVASILAFIILLFSVPGIIGGIALLKHKNWSRILVLVLGFLNLINIPLGTILGAYTIWVLMNDEAKLLLTHGGD
jgi:p-aminobenzoyl-glutamate transporter AbgT